MNRRQFLKSSVLAGAGTVSALSCASRSRIIGANDEIRVAAVGFRSKGAQHIEVFHGLPGVRVAALCEVDEEILNREAAKFRERGEPVETYGDVRRVIDNKEIDALVVAAPNHWHSLIAIWALQAGKDVYVEKPVSHNIWEGRKLVEAARKYKRIVQAGTQNRSDTGLRAAVAYIQEGNLGKILWGYGLWYKRRQNIGLVREPQKVPETLNYDLWTGPAPLVPLMRQELHYDWHWFWSFGNGDMGNLGVHQIDDCRWAVGQSGYPRRVMSFGGRFGFDDNGETPNTQITLFDYTPAPLIIEVRNLPMKKGVRVMDHLRGVRAGNIIQCENGYFAGGRGGGWIYDNDGVKIKQFPGDGGGDHQANFIAAVRSRKEKDLRADVFEGHISSALCHLANISYRLGSPVTPEQLGRDIGGYEQAQGALDRFRAHLEANEIDLGKYPLISGPWLQVDEENERLTGPFAEKANAHLRRQYRSPFVVPEKV